MEPSWETREKPLLRQIVQAEEAGEDLLSAGIGSGLGLEPSEVMLAIDRLQRAGYIEATVVRTGDAGIIRTVVHRSAPKALREVGLWPAEESMQALIDLFERLAEREQDPERKTRLQAVTSALRSLVSFAGDLGSAVGGAISVYGTW